MDLRQLFNGRRVAWAGWWRVLGRLLPGLLLTAAAACGNNDSGSTNPPASADIHGTWTYFETYANTSLGVTCTDQGLLTISQTNTAFSATVEQTGSCTGPGGSADNSGTATVTGGTVSLTTVRFSFTSCDYLGALLNTPVDSASGSVSCSVSLDGQTVTLTGAWFAVKGVDLAPPTAAGSMTLPAGDTLAVPSDTVAITVNAGDDRKVLWAGYRLGPPANVQDSVRVAADTASPTFRVVAQASWEGVSSLTVFARDALGRETSLPAGTVRVLNLVRRPFHTLALGTTATDMVFDAKRDALYLVEPDLDQVAVLDLSTFAPGTPLALPYTLTGARAMGLDLVPGGDSLIVALTGDPRVAVIDLTSGASGTVDIAGTDYVSNVRVAANGRALIFGSGSSGMTTFFGIWAYDLGTGTQERITTVGVSGNVGGGAELARSGDHSRIVLLDKNSGCGYVYSAASGTFGSCVSFGFSVPATPSGSLTGDRWLIRNLLRDGALGAVSTLFPGDSGASAIAPDASVAYFPTDYGYQTVRLSDGAVVERVRVPVTATRLTALEDGQRLVIWTDIGLSSDQVLTDRVTVVDLR